MLIVTIFTVVIFFFLFAGWWLVTSINWGLGANMFMFVITFFWAISWAKLIVVTNRSF